MKNFFSIIALVLCVGVVACSEKYDADTAESNYVPSQGKRVASLKTTYTMERDSVSYDYSFEHWFSYDAKGRIKSVNSNIVHYVADKVFFDTIYTRCNITSKADYLYKGENLEVAYSVSREFPDDHARNNGESGVDKGVFNTAGVLTHFVATDFIYLTNSLYKCYANGNVHYIVERDGSGNVSGYMQLMTSTDEVINDKSGAYSYSTLGNKTNFDFSAYFGYWGVERAVRMISVPYYATYQLAAFGMLGAGSKDLPAGDWELEDGYPVSCVVDGRKTVITYCE